MVPALPSVLCAKTPHISRNASLCHDAITSSTSMPPHRCDLMVNVTDVKMFERQFSNGSHERLPLRRSRRTRLDCISGSSHSMTLSKSASETMGQLRFGSGSVRVLRSFCSQPQQHAEGSRSIGAASCGSGSASLHLRRRAGSDENFVDRRHRLLESKSDRSSHRGAVP